MELKHCICLLVAVDAVVRVLVFLSWQTELCWRKADSHLELDGVHYGFYWGSVTLWLSVVICWRPWPPQSPAPCFTALCPQGAHQCTRGGQPPHPGRSKVKIKACINQPTFFSRSFSSYPVKFSDQHNNSPSPMYLNIFCFMLVSGEQLPYWPLARAWCQHGVTSWTTPCHWCAPTTMSTLMCFPFSTYAHWNTWPMYSRLLFIGLRPWTSRPL